MHATNNVFCIKQNEEVILMDPSYPMYEVLCKLNNIKFKLGNLIKFSIKNRRP